MSADRTVAVVVMSKARGFAPLGAGMVVETMDKLPPGTHRVTVHDDGTVEVVELLEFIWRLRTADELRGNWWVDAPATPEDGAR